MHLSFIQAVADALKVTIQIVESNQGFALLVAMEKNRCVPYEPP